MNLLLCIGKNNSQTLFQYKFDTDPYREPEEANFKVCPVLEPYEDFFNFSLRFVGERHMKIIMMTTNAKAMYSAKGIPDALIHEASYLFDRVIVSSTKRGTAGEFRTDDADKVWQRLVKKRLATFDEITDQFTYIGYQPVNKKDPGYENYDFDRINLLQHYIDMPVMEMKQIKPVWDINHEPEHTEFIEVSYNLLSEKVDFGELRTDALFNYQSGDHRFADILYSWEKNLPISPAELSLADQTKLQISDGRHRTILTGLLGNDKVRVTVQKDMKDKILQLLNGDQTPQTTVEPLDDQESAE